MEDLIQLFTTGYMLVPLSIVVMTGIIAYAARRLFDFLRSSPKTGRWLKILGETFYAPSLILIWGYGILTALDVLTRKTDLFLSFEVLKQFRQIYFICGITWLLLCWKEELEKYMRQKLVRKSSVRGDHELITVVGRMTTVALFVIAVMLLLPVFGISPSGLLASGAVGGIAISFAAKDIVANFFGGIMIYMNRPFLVGDWIYSPNKNFEGTVEEIGFYMTRIRTFERRPTFIPNALMTDAIVENPGRMYNRRIKETIGVRYQDVGAVDQITEAINDMLRQHPAIDQEQTLLVDLVGFGAHSLNIEVYCFTKTTNWGEWRKIRQKIYLKIAEIIASKGAEIAFPTQTVHLEKEESFGDYAALVDTGLAPSKKA